MSSWDVEVWPVIGIVLVLVIDAGRVVKESAVPNQDCDGFLPVPPRESESPSKSVASRTEAFGLIIVQGTVVVREGAVTECRVVGCVRDIPTVRVVPTIRSNNNGYTTMYSCGM